MPDLKNIRVSLAKSNFDITVKKLDGKLTVTDPITVKNQINELRSLTDIPNVNAIFLVDGATIIYNSNTEIYEIRPLEKLPNLTVSNTAVLNRVSANGSFGLEGTVLSSNGSYVYWSAVGAIGTITEIIAGSGLVGGGDGGSVTLSVNTNYIATLASNSALYANVANYANFLNGKPESSLNANTALYANVAAYLNGKQETQLNVATALFANIANVSYFLNGKVESDLNANSALFANVANYANFLNGKSESSLNANTALYANNATYAYGKQESQLNANSAVFLSGKIESQLNANSAVFANVANFLNGKAESAIDANTALFANVASFLNGKVESQFNANSALYANVANFLNGKPEGQLDANTALFANNATYAYGKQESQLNANTALYANVANFLNGKPESSLNANTALFANVASFLNGKQESQLDANTALFANVANYLAGTAAGNLNVNSAYYATISNTAIFAYQANTADQANNSTYAYGRQQIQLNVNSALYLVGGGGWGSPGAIGSETPNTAVFTTIQHSGLIPTEGTNIDQILTIVDNIAVTTDWQNTSINSNDLPAGSYMIQMISPYAQIFTGVMSWYASDANNGESEEILLHRASPDVFGTLFLRIYRSPATGTDMVLQIAGTLNKEINSYTYKFRRMI